VATADKIAPTARDPDRPRLGSFTRAQHILPVFRIWAAQLVFPALRIRSAELFLILCSVGAAQHLFPALRIRSAELFLILCSVGAAQKISRVLGRLRSALATWHLALLALDMR
jgi:hypothetical protein